MRERHFPRVCYSCRAPAIAVAAKAAYADAARRANKGGSVVAEGAHPDR